MAAAADVLVLQHKYSKSARKWTAQQIQTSDPFLGKELRVTGILITKARLSLQPKRLTLINFYKKVKTAV
jgi:hypothetical protein